MSLKSKFLFIFIIFSIINVITPTHGHSHDDDHHGHSHGEAPSFKYSRAANEEHQPPAHSHGHDHGSHGHGSHGHNHGSHSHNHGSHDHSHESINANKADSSIPKTTLTNSELWLHAMGSTLLISAAPFFILFFVPLDNTKEKQPLLKILLAFASGGLLGDAFLHLIPHAQMGNEEGHSHSHSHGHTHGAGEEHGHDMTIGLWVLAGIVSFLIVEKVVRILKGGHSHSHSHQTPAKSPKDKSKKLNDKSKVSEDKSKKSQDITKDKSKEDISKKSEDKTKKTNTDKPSINKAKSSDDESEDEPKEIKVAGYLNLAADFSHNFTDGLAIGSSYLAGNTVGVITTLTILLHEVPHEIGDFAILLQSGVSRRNAMLLQLTTAIGALAGTALSLVAQNTTGAMAANWILPFTAGGFIYIALVSVIPELLDEEKPSFIQTVLQVCALLAGVYMMVIIAEYE